MIYQVTCTCGKVLPVSDVIAAGIPQSYEVQGAFVPPHFKPGTSTPCANVGAAMIAESIRSALEVRK